MIDFLMIATRSTKRGIIEIYPKFIIKKSSDLMIRGGDFYAIWVEERGLWSTDEQDALYLMDQELDRYAEENRQHFDSNIKVLHLWDAETGMIDFWHKYCQRQMRDSFHMLDEKLMFSNVKTNKKDYASKRLSYPLEQGTYPAYEKLMSTLYSPDERMKIEWAIGAIVHGDSKKLQKFMVLYGAAGTGKSTVLNIIQQLFEGYYSVFDAKALGSSSNSFALESFKGNPLVAIQHDGDLSRIEDNTRLNSLVSHEIMTVNEKFKSTYANSFKCFLIMGTNKPVKITDAKSGLIRRLIDVSPSGEKLSMKEYNQAVKQIEFELGAIAYHCQEVYLDDPVSITTEGPEIAVNKTGISPVAPIPSRTCFDGKTLCYNPDQLQAEGLLKTFQQLAQKAGIVTRVVQRAAEVESDGILVDGPAPSETTVRRFLDLGISLYGVRETNVILRGHLARDKKETTNA
jgi:energy-coupling factor transporter ATP-binding protein EcfA2